VCYLRFPYYIKGICDSTNGLPLKNPQGDVKALKALQPPANDYNLLGHINIRSLRTTSATVLIDPLHENMDNIAARRSTMVNEAEGENDKFSIPRPDPIEMLRTASVTSQEGGSLETESIASTASRSPLGLERCLPVSPAPATATEEDESPRGFGQSQAQSSSSSALSALKQQHVDRFPTSPAGFHERGHTSSSTPTALSFTRSLIFYGEGSMTTENVLACQMIQEARKFRKKYQGERGVGKGVPCATNKKALSYKWGENSIIEIYDEDESEPTNLTPVPTIMEFMSDYNRLVEIVRDGATRSFSWQRLHMLNSAFKQHQIANGQVENEAQSRLLGTDFFRTAKVDNHIHLAAAASAKQFVDFVRTKLMTEPDTVVLEEGDTLKEVFDKAGLDTDHLTIDAFNVLADYSVYQRFDNFNAKYSPFKLAQMRRIFLKVDNAIQGRYFAELTKLVLQRHEDGKGHKSFTEMRLSIYGMERNEWEKCANWVLRDWEGGVFPGPVLSSKNRWLVQIPRLWRIYSRKNKKGRPTTSSPASFNEMLENIFVPIVEATLNPEKHPKVAELLNHIVGFDSVDDEGNAESGCSCTSPKKWTNEENPAYCWQLYYLWANIKVVNEIRKSKGLNTFTLRPHAGETGDVMHLAATYILADSINHGINLDKQVTLQHLYYLDQIGLSVSPLSNNFLFRKMKDSPFPKFFRRGLNVTLSTDDPLLFHMSDDPLLEEYSVARATFDLSMTDLCELSRNSIMQSGFEDSLKKKWLGENYGLGAKHCDSEKTHVPYIRAKFRAEHLALEHMLIRLMAAGKKDSILKEMQEQFGIARTAHRNILMEHNLLNEELDRTVFQPG